MNCPRGEYVQATATAYAFHTPGTTEAVAWATDHLTAPLAGHVAHNADQQDYNFTV